MDDTRILIDGWITDVHIRRKIESEMGMVYQGTGFVQFSHPEDALRARNQFNGMTWKIIGQKDREFWCYPSNREIVATEESLSNFGVGVRSCKDPEMNLGV